MNFLSGFKTVLTGLALAVGPATISYLGNVDVTKTFGLSPTAGAVVGAVMIGLRAITSSPIFQPASSTSTSTSS